MTEALAHYEKASPALLIEEDPNPSAIRRLADREKAAEWVEIKSNLERRIGMLRSWRFPYIQHWALVAQYNCPRRSLWLTEGGVDTPVPNAMVRGLPINQAIVDTTPVLAARVAVAGMVSGLMSPSRPWFQLGVKGKDRDKLERPALLWLEKVVSVIQETMAESNFYTSAAQMMEDLIHFGTGPVIIYEDDETVINCLNPVVGEYYLTVGSGLRAQGFARLFASTVSQIVEMFGLENCPNEIQELWRQKGAALDTERVVAHFIEPNAAIQPNGHRDPIGKIPGKFVFKETYWIWGASSEYPHSERGFYDLPFIAPRWWVTGNEP